MFFHVSKADFDAAVQTRRTAIPTLSDAAVVAGTMQIVVMIEVRSFVPPQSRLIVSYSAKFFQLLTNSDPPSLLPTSRSRGRRPTIFSPRFGAAERSARSAAAASGHALDFA